MNIRVETDSEFTPAPWRVLPTPLRDGISIATADAVLKVDDESQESLESGTLICVVQDNESAEADARLIAAAPVLLDALEKMTSLLEWLDRRYVIRNTAPKDEGAMAGWGYGEISTYALEVIDLAKNGPPVETANQEP